jgi:hypothetical protein
MWNIKFAWQGHADREIVELPSAKFSMKILNGAH